MTSREPTPIGDGAEAAARGRRLTAPQPVLLPAPVTAVAVPAAFRRKPPKEETMTANRLMNPVNGAQDAVEHALNMLGLISSSKLAVALCAEGLGRYLSDENVTALVGIVRTMESPYRQEDHLPSRAASNGNGTGTGPERMLP